MPKSVIEPADIAELATRATPVAYRTPKASSDGHYFVENIDAEEARFKSEWEAIYSAQVLDAARDLCLRIGATYSSRASDGKLGSIKRNRNNWKADVANECADQIDSLMQSMTMTGRGANETRSD